MRIMLVLSSLLVAIPAAGQEIPAWYVRGELGGAAIHDSALGPWAGARIGRSFGSGVLAVDFGASGGTSDGGFGTVTGGLELRAFPRSDVSLFVRLEGGAMNDRLGGCGVAGLGAGLAVRVTPTVSVRGGVLGCAHCGDGSGPILGFVGVEYRW